MLKGNVKNFAHNFSHSFVSLENIIDGKPIFEDIKVLVKKSNHRVFEVQWVPKKRYWFFSFSRRILKAIHNYQKKIPTFLEACSIDSNDIVAYSTRIFLAKNRQIIVEADIKDSNGSSFKVNIYDFV